MAPLSSASRPSLLLFLRPQCLNIRHSSSLLTTSLFHVRQGGNPSARNSHLNFGSVAVAHTDRDNKGKNDVKPRSVSVTVAFELLQAGNRYLDVRTSGEFIAGHPPAAINIPYYHICNGGEGTMLKNSKFLEEVSTIFSKEENIVVGCKTGRRSLMAATDLHAAGFTNVTDVAGGYTEWKENGLPTTE